MRLLVTPSFVRASKKLHRLQKADLDKAVRAISDDPVLEEDDILAALEYAAAQTDHAILVAA